MLVRQVKFLKSQSNRISDEEVINPFFQADRVDYHGRQAIAVVAARLDLELGLIPTALKIDR
jgi:hypothetical protein